MEHLHRLVNFKSRRKLSDLISPAVCQLIMELYPVIPNTEGIFYFKFPTEFSISSNSFFSEITIVSIPSPLLINIKYLLHGHLQLKTVRWVYRCKPVYTRMCLPVYIHFTHCTKEGDSGRAISKRADP